MGEYDVVRLGLILAVQAEVEGMKAMNQTRIQEGHAVAYDDVAFVSKAEELRNLAYCHGKQL